jgi:GT2 family glycosyltransferase
VPGTLKVPGTFLPSELDVSIIIVNLNDRQLLEECLTSIYKHTRNCLFEIIVVDNHSSDGSVVMVKTKFSQVHLIENMANNRYAIANNQGLDIARGKYVFYLNGDTVLLGNAVKEMVDFLEREEDAGAVGCQLVYPDGRHQDSCFRFPSAMNLFYLICLSRFYWKTRLAGNYLFHNLTTAQRVDFVIGACLMVRRDILITCQGMDPEYYFYGEDSDLCYRIRKAGWNIYYLPKSERVVHYGGVSSTINLFDNNQRTKHFWGWKSRFLFVKKHYSLWKKLLIVLAMLKGFGVNVLLYSMAFLKRRDWEYTQRNLQAHWKITREAFKVF